MDDLFKQYMLELKEKVKEKKIIRSEDLKDFHLLNQLIYKDFIHCLRFITHNASRDPSYAKTALLSYFIQNYLESATAICFLTQNGMVNSVRRELRYLLELSIKHAYMEQESPNSTIEEKLAKYQAVIDSHKISIKENLKLELLTNRKMEFKGELGYLYGQTCKYVHLTKHQIDILIEEVDKGNTVGFESKDTVESLNLLISRVYASVITLLFHAVPDYVAGDWFVDESGVVGWYFNKSKFIADLDSNYDYKHERQDRLGEIQKERKSLVEF